MRKSNSIRSKRDLPKWFHLSKYEPAKSLDIVGWYEQLSLRGHWRASAEWWRTNTAKIDNFPRNSPGLEELLTFIGEHPIFNIRELEAALVNRRITHGLASLREFEAASASEAGVHPLSVEEFYINELWLEPARRDYAQKFFEEVQSRRISNPEKIMPYQAVLQRIVEFRRRMRHKKDGPGPFEVTSDNSGTEYRLWMADSLSSHQFPERGSMVLFAVDLDLPDVLLHQQFKTQIERLRFLEQESGLPPPKRFARPDFEFWIRMGILPYLDLTLWAYLNDLNIPNRVMADAIYSDGEGDPDRVRKVTKVWADDLTGSEHAGAMKQLKVQAALETSRSVNAERETD